MGSLVDLGTTQELQNSFESVEKIFLPPPSNVWEQTSAGLC